MPHRFDALAEWVSFRAVSGGRKRHQGADHRGDRGAAWEIAPTQAGPLITYPGGTAFRVYSSGCAKLIGSVTIPAVIFGPDPVWSVEADGTIKQSAAWGGDYGAECVT